MEINTYAQRFQKAWDWMAQEGISLVMMEDTETRRDQNIRWLTGHPGDALLFLSSDKNAVLVAWDVNLAKIYARNSPVIIVPYNDFDRKPLNALVVVSRTLGIPIGSKIEIPSVTPYPVFLDYVGELTDYDILCRNNSLGAEIRKMRSVKNDDEIAVIRKAAGFTNEIIDLLEKNVRSGKIKTEADAALFIQQEARKRNCEGTSFETLAAGPGRSFAIHAFPSSTGSPFGGQGLSILDFGLKYNGYCTDVTLTFARDLNPRQEKLVSLVEKAAKLALSMAYNGTRARDIAAAVDALFAKSKKQMPHGLGHGVGLQEHEYPVLRNSSDNDWVLEPGMIFTIEPGLYDPQLGGCRLENDVLVTSSGQEILTKARIIRL
ncbi:MAG: Xaa-Pro peptidase family protein [Treponema sp.]|nr:Xaa-Pro peptidase family protein [Treponema sp.]